MGREEEIAYAREHGIPVKGGTEAPPYSIDDNIWGRSSEGGPIEDLAEPPRDDVFELVADPRDAPDEPQDLRLEFERGVPGGARRRAAGPGGADRALRRGGARHGVGIVDHIEDRIVGPEGARPLRGARGRRSCSPPTRSSRSSSARSTRTASSARSTSSGRSSSTPGSGTSRCCEDLNAYMDSVNEQVTGEITMRLYKGSATAVARSSPERPLRPGAGRLRRVRRPVLAAGEPGLHRAVEPPVADGVRICATGERRDMNSKGYTVLGWIVWQIGSRVAKREDGAEPRRSSARPASWRWCWWAASLAARGGRRRLAGRRARARCLAQRYATG